VRAQGDETHLFADSALDAGLHFLRPKRDQVSGPSDARRQSGRAAARGSGAGAARRGDESFRGRLQRGAL